LCRHSITPSAPNFSPTFSAASVSTSVFPPRTRYVIFPYTTLFRSHDPAQPLEQHYRDRDRRKRRSDDKTRASGLGRRERGRRQRDRKSTRLNSSHVSCSYAVFCLKKKKIKSTREQFRYVRMRLDCI